MWHELVINGIGGNTIEQAKQNMSYSEFVQWAEYRNKHGSLNAALRIDRVLTQVAAIFGRAYLKFSDGSKSKPEDFTPWPAPAAPEHYGSTEEVFNLLKSIATKENGK